MSLVKQSSGCVFNIGGPMGETFKFTPVAIVNIMDMMWDSSPPRANKKCQEPHTELH